MPFYLSLNYFSENIRAVRLAFTVFCQQVDCYEGSVTKVDGIADYFDTFVILDRAKVA